MIDSREMLKPCSLKLDAELPSDGALLPAQRSGGVPLGLPVGDHDAVRCLQTQISVNRFPSASPALQQRIRSGSIHSDLHIREIMEG